MTLSEFQTLIQGKFFVELSNDNSVLSFTGLSEESVAIRNAAASAGVLVFLKTIHRIWARNEYWSTGDEIVSKVSELEATIQSMGTPLTNLAGLVATNQTNIASNTAAITENTKRLLGDSSVVVPEKPNDPDDPDYDDDYAEYISLKNQHDGLINRVVDLEGQIAQATGNSGGLSQAVNDLVDARLQSVLSGQIADYLETNDYITSSDLSTIEDDISTLQSTIVNKAAQSDFTALAGLVGATGLTDTTHWNHIITDSQDPNYGENKTIVTVVNELLNTTQVLETTVTGIPKFVVRVVTGTNTGEPDVSLAERDSSTIYLVKSPSDEQEAEGDDLFTEYIWVNKNAAYTSQDPIPTNPETNQPYAVEMIWEKLGRQAFKMINYFTKDELEPLMNELQDWIDQNATAFTQEYAEQLEDNTSDIADLKTTIQSIQTALNILIQNGEFQLTGSSIYTNDSKTSYIADDIATLQGDISTLDSNKMDKNAMTWVIISDSIQENNGE